MKLVVSDKNYLAAAEEMLITLLPAEPVEYAGVIPAEGDYLSVELRAGPKTAWAGASVRLKGRDFEGAARLSLGRTPSEGRQARRRAVKYAVYRALRKATGQKPEWGSLTGVRPSKIALALLGAGYTGEEIERELLKRYDVSARKRRLLLETAGAAQRAAALRRPHDISLYVGIPFCPSRCVYCSFISTASARSKKLIPAYLGALSREIADAGPRIGALGLRVNTLYIGGGTPTILSAGELSALLETLVKSFDLSGLLELTVEAGRPDTIDDEKLRVLKRFSVDRISINPQTTDDGVLLHAGRAHTAADVFKAYEAARRAGGFKINMDLIAGLFTQTPESFDASLRDVVALFPENITVHNLAVKKGAALSDKRRVYEAVPAVRGMINGAAGVLKRAGYAPYYTYRQKYAAGGLENTGFSRDGADCLYNIYIMEELQSVLSLGAGAVSKVKNERTGVIKRRANPKYPEEYIGMVMGGNMRAAGFFHHEFGGDT